MKLSDKILTDEDIQKIIRILNPEETEYGVEYGIYPENNLEKCSVFVPSLIETILDRDKTIKELQKEAEDNSWQYTVVANKMVNLELQNEVMREALEWILNRVEDSAIDWVQDIETVINETFNEIKTMEE